MISPYPKAILLKIVNFTVSDPLFLALQNLVLKNAHHGATRITFSMKLKPSLESGKGQTRSPEESEEEVFRPSDGKPKPEQHRGTRSGWKWAVVCARCGCALGNDRDIAGLCT
jgi:hypothetical protein